jgi:hypothetical protein
MHSPRQGSAAAARKATPQSAVVTSVELSIRRLEHGIALAGIAARGQAPEEAVAYLQRAMRSASRTLRALRLRPSTQ